MSTSTISGSRLFSTLFKLVNLFWHRTVHTADGPAMNGSLFEKWHRRTHYRRHLHRLAQTNPGLLEDIGLNVRAARTEKDKPFWRSLQKTDIEGCERKPNGKANKSSLTLVSYKTGSTSHKTPCGNPTQSRSFSSYFDRPEVL